jgi:hypothetical protein
VAVCNFKAENFMTGAETAQIITAVGVLVSAVASATAVLLGVINRSGIKNVHNAVNGKMEELVSVVREASFAKGVKSEKDNPS